MEKIWLSNEEKFLRSHCHVDEDAFDRIAVLAKHDVQKEKELYETIIHRFRISKVTRVKVFEWENEQLRGRLNAKANAKRQG